MLKLPFSGPRSSSHHSKFQDYVHQTHFQTIQGTEGTLADTVSRSMCVVQQTPVSSHETNKKLRDMPMADLDRPETRREIERQADAERANGRRLSNLTETGKALLL